MGTLWVGEGGGCWPGNVCRDEIEILKKKYHYGGSGKIYRWLLGLGLELVQNLINTKSVSIVNSFAIVTKSRLSIRSL